MKVTFATNFLAVGIGTSLCFAGTVLMGLMARVFPDWIFLTWLSYVLVRPVSLFFEADRGQQSVILDQNPLLLLFLLVGYWIVLSELCFLIVAGVNRFCRQMTSSNSPPE